MQGSYQLDNFTENKDIEVKRLKSQVELFFEKEFETYKKLGLKDGMSIIECGSGPGYLITNILKRFPNCEATALEIDPYLFDILSANSEADGKKLYNPILGSIYDIDMPDNSADFIVTRLVVEHLQDPYKALSELHRILKPNGILIVVSNDFAYHVLTYPVIPELDEMFNAYIKSRFNEGGNPLVGRQLPVFFERSGFSNVSMEIVTAHSQLKGDQAMLNAENVNISRSLVREGFLKAETLENLLEKWVEMLNTPDHVIYRQLFIIGGKKDGSTSINFEALHEEYTKNLEKINSKSNKQNGAKTGLIDIDPKGLESLILSEWEKALNIQNISVTDNFFDIGGSSVLIPDIITNIVEKTGASLKILDFFKYSTVKSLANKLLTTQPADDQDQPMNAPSKESFRSRFSTDDEQKSKIMAQRNKFKNRRK